jgi:glucokinase
MTNTNSEQIQKTYYIGLDLGGTTASGILMEPDGRRLADQEIDTLAHQGHMAVIDRLAQLAQNLVEESGLNLADVTATGIGLPGVLDLDKGETLFLPNLPGTWPNVPVEALLEEKLGHPVYILNDVRSITLGETTFGAGKAVQNMVCLAIGTGIGGGTVINGQLYLGNDGTAGEWGHQTVEPDGPRCGCGNYGCLEAVASGSAISAMGMRAVRQGLTTAIRDLSGGDLDKITPKLIAEAARQGDDIAQEIYQRAGQYIGIAVSNTIVGLAPHMVVIAGGVARAGDLLMDPIKETVKRRVHVTPLDKVQIVFGELGIMAGAMGAAEWAHQRTAGTTLAD